MESYFAKQMAALRSWLAHERYPRLLFGLLAVLSALLAIAPHDRSDWLLENSLLCGAVAVLVATHVAMARLPTPARRFDRRTRRT